MFGEAGGETQFAAITRTGIILAGDLYSVPEANKRGGFGDVTEVWEAFGSRFAWTACVLGNHDHPGRSGAVGHLIRAGKLHIFDGEVIEVDGLRIGGVGWICGNPEKPGRRAEADQLALIELAAKEKPDLLILHEGPNRTPEQRGNPEIRQLLERTGVPFTACGHVHWDVPLGAHGKGQILNCDSRVMILTRPAKWTN